MTFTEAAVEILRRSGKPLHFKDITSQAIAEGLLSHEGQTPEETMSARLLAMASREHERKVVATAPGVFGLAEWGLAQEEEPTLDAASLPDDSALPYRGRERHPPIQAELVVGRREERRRRDTDEEGRRRRRYPRPAEVAHQWLREKNEAVTLAELAAALRADDRIPEALERDLGSFEKALREENRRREESRRPILFTFEGDTIRGVEAVEAPKEKPARAAPARKEKREPVRIASVEEQTRAVVRSIRRRFSSLDISAVERMAVALLETQGFRDLNMNRRSAKEGPLYLARRRWGANDIRYVVRILRPGRDLGRTEVQDARRDLAHFSAQIALVLTTGDCSREAKSEANAPGLAPVMLYGGEAVAESLVEAGLGVSKRLIEWPEYDDEFFAAIGAGETLPEQEEAVPEEAPAAETAPAAEEGRDKEREKRRRRDRRRRKGEKEEKEPAAEAAQAVEPSGEPAGEATPAPAGDELAVPAEGDVAQAAPVVEERPAPSAAEPEPAPPEVSTAPTEAVPPPLPPAEPEPEAPAERVAAPSGEEPPPAAAAGVESTDETEADEKTGSESA